MQHGVSAIRGTRTRPRFVHPGGRRGDEALGLQRLARTTTGVRAGVTSAALQPLAAVRAAGRSATLAATPTRAATSRRADGVRWARPRTLLRDARLLGASPWHG